ncbi:MAG: hypothetical protein ACI9J2_000879 [Saprospiraceae bacterium]|jgi:hypothetical protein
MMSDLVTVHVEPGLIKNAGKTDMNITFGLFWFEFGVLPAMAGITLKILSD